MFFPRQLAKQIPIPSNKLQDIFNKVSVKPGSVLARIIEYTIKALEEPAIEGEEKYCATSLESILDFTISRLGKMVQVISTEVEKDAEFQTYTVKAGVKKMAGDNDKIIVCHKQKYPYAAFLCHKTGTTKAYSVPLEGADGTKVKAVAVCHVDTSKWDPNHLAFQVLKIKPGSLPVCHFLPEDDAVWVPK